MTKLENCRIIFKNSMAPLCCK